jgi:hypothetical protein
MGIIILGNILKLVNNDVGNLVQGLGFGSGIGTTAHVIDQMYPNTMTPHHDVIGIISLPFIYATDKTNLIKNKSITNNLYGGAIGLTMQHLLTEGCSFCGNTYCPPGTNLC